MNKAVWITWEDQRRNKSLSKALGVELHQFNLDAHRLIRYPLLILKTLYIFIISRPNFIFAQNPSIILALLSVVYGRITRRKVIIDAHNAGIYPFEGKVAWATKLAQFIFRNASLMIVTNSHLKQYVESCGGRAFVLPDPFPEINKSIQSIPLTGKVNYLLISTWAADEPYEEVIKAFAILSGDQHLYITGNSRGKEKNLSIKLPDNVNLTGFISNEEFDRLLISCDCIIDLTTRKDCLVCGAYEAIAAGTPLILSNTEVLRDYFSTAAIYTKNESLAIVEAIDNVSSDLNLAKQRVDDYYQHQKTSWQSMKNQLIEHIQSIS